MIGLICDEAAATTLAPQHMPVLPGCMRRRLLSDSRKVEVVFLTWIYPVLFIYFFFLSSFTSTLKTHPGTHTRSCTLKGEGENTHTHTCTQECTRSWRKRDSRSSRRKAGEYSIMLGEQILRVRLYFIFFFLPFFVFQTWRETSGCSRGTRTLGGRCARHRRSRNASLAPLCERRRAHACLKLLSAFAICHLHCPDTAG